MNRIGLYIFGAANVAMGILNLVWGDFDPAHQPIQALGDAIPGREIYAYITGILLVGGGLALLSGGRRGRFGALILAAVNLIIAIFWLPRLYTAPHYLGLSVSVIAGVLGGVGRQLIIVGAAVLAYVGFLHRDASRADSTTVAARWIFGLSSIDFGVVHLSTIAGNVAYVPPWMPFGREFWVALTGVAFILAGIAMLSSALDVLAARLLAIMLVVFSAVTLIPGLIASRHQLANWGGNVHEFVLVGAVWMFAEWLAARQRSAQPLAAA